MKRALVIALLGFAPPAAAQMSVTTIGATDAAACYQNAQSHFSTSTNPCDAAIRDGNTTTRDRMKTYVNRGIIYNRNGDLNAAIDDFNAALGIDSDQPEALVNRGNSWFLAGLYDDALTDYHRSLDAGLTKPWMAWYNIGLAHDAKNQPQEARAAYETALELSPNFYKAQSKLEGRG